MHICDMFDEIPMKASRGPFKSLFKYLHLYHYSIVILHFWKCHGVLGSDLSPGPEKVAQNLESQEHNNLFKSPFTSIPMLWE